MSAVIYSAGAWGQLGRGGRVAGAVARPGSHRSVRAQLRHTARQVTGSLIRSAIRWCNVDTVPGSCAPAMFPSNGSMTWHLLPSPGSERIPFPCFTGTMRCSDFLPPLPPHSVAFARRYHVVHLVASLRCTAGRPRFLRNPCVSMPCSPTPAGPTRQALRRSRLGPRYVHNEGSHDQINLSGLHHTAWTLAVYASQSGLPQSHARLASRCWPLYGTGLVTRRIPTKGFRVVSYISSSLLKRPGARTFLILYSGSPWNPGIAASRF